MSELPERSRVFSRQLLDKAREDGLRFAIVRGLEEDSNRASDVDLVTDAPNEFLAYARRFAEAQGGMCLKPIDRHYVHILRVIFPNAGGRTFSAKIDIHNGEQWRGIAYLKTSDILARATTGPGLPRYSACDALVANLFQWALNSPLLSTSRLARVRKCSDELLAAGESIRNCRLQIPQSVMDEVEAAILSGDFQRAARSVYEKRNRIWRAIAWANRVETAIGLGRTAIRKLLYLAQPPGLFISIIGPDGAGKTTLIEGLCADLELVAPGKLLKVQHWRPNCFKPLAQLRPAESRGGGKSPLARPPGLFESFARYVYYTLDYLVGYIVKTRPVLVKEGMVICDRYIDDYVIAPPWRSRVDLPNIAKRALAWIAPRPDMKFYLRAEAQTLSRRKSDETLEELSMLVRAYDRAARRDARIVIVDATLAPSELRRQVCATLARRYA